MNLVSLRVRAILVGSPLFLTLAITPANAEPIAGPQLEPMTIERPTKLVTPPPLAAQALAAALGRVTKTPVEPDLAAAVDLTPAGPVKVGQAALILSGATLAGDITDGSIDVAIEGNTEGLTLPAPPTADAEPRARRAYTLAFRRFFGRVGSAAIELTTRARSAYVVDCELADGTYDVDVTQAMRSTIRVTGNRLTFAFVSAASGPTGVRIWNQGAGRWSFRKCRVVPQRGA